MGPKVRAATRFVARGGTRVGRSRRRRAGACCGAGRRDASAPTIRRTEPVGVPGAADDRLGVRFFRGTYLDSVLQLSASRAMRAVDGVEWAGRPWRRRRRRRRCTARGSSRRADGRGSQRPGARRRRRRRASRRRGSRAGRAAAFSARGRRRLADRPAAERRDPCAEAVRAQPGANVAIVSVPGEYAALEAHQALTAGLHVLLFSDGVPRRGGDRAQGHAIEPRPARDGAGCRHRGARRGVGLGFANAVPPGPGRCRRGRRHRRAGGVGPARPVGRRRLAGHRSRRPGPVRGGRRADGSLRCRGPCAADPATEVILLVSKPPPPRSRPRCWRVPPATPAGRGVPRPRT